jgi:hypothetical protein
LVSCTDASHDIRIVFNAGNHCVAEADIVRPDLLRSTGPAAGTAGVSSWR